MQTIQVDLNHTNAQHHHNDQGQVEGQQNQDNEEGQGHELVIQQQHIVIPQPPPSMFSVKNEDHDQLKLENPDPPESSRHLEAGSGRNLEANSGRNPVFCLPDHQRHHPRGRQILVDSSGQLVLDGEDTHSRGHTGGRTEGHSGDRTEGLSGGHTEVHTEGHTGGHSGGHTRGHTEGHSGGHTGGHTEVHTGGHTGGHTEGHTGSHIHIHSSVTLDLNSILQAANISTENQY